MLAVTSRHLRHAAIQGQHHVVGRRGAPGQRGIVDRFGQRGRRGGVQIGQWLAARNTHLAQQDALGELQFDTTN